MIIGESDSLGPVRIAALSESRRSGRGEFLRRPVPKHRRRRTQGHQLGRKGPGRLPGRGTSMPFGHRKHQQTEDRQARAVPPTQSRRSHARFAKHRLDPPPQQTSGLENTHQPQSQPRPPRRRSRHRQQRLRIAPGIPLPVHDRRRVGNLLPYPLPPRPHQPNQRMPPVHGQQQHLHRPAPQIRTPDVRHLVQQDVPPRLRVQSFRQSTRHQDHRTPQPTDRRRRQPRGPSNLRNTLQSQGRGTRDRRLPPVFPRRAGAPDFATKSNPGARHSRQQDSHPGQGAHSQSGLPTQAHFVHASAARRRFRRPPREQPVPVGLGLDPSPAPRRLPGLRCEAQPLATRHPIPERDRQPPRRRQHQLDQHQHPQCLVHRRIRPPAQSPTCGQDPQDQQTRLNRRRPRPPHPRRARLVEPGNPRVHLRPFPLRARISASISANSASEA